MKVVTYSVIALLIATLAGGAYFFFFMHRPLAVEYEKLKAGQPEFDKMRKELARYKDREQADSGWITPVADKLRTGLSRDIADGKAEVLVAGNRIVINIAESLLYTPHSVTFAKESPQSLATLAALLKDIKDKDIIVGNSTAPAPAQAKGRKRVPTKDARTLAAGRTLELVKYLVKNGVADDSLIAAAYAAQMPERGFKLKAEKVIIVIAAPAAAQAPPVAAAKPESKPAVATKTTPTPAAASQIKTIPISTVPPKKVP